MRSGNKTNTIYAHIQYMTDKDIGEEDNWLCQDEKIFIRTVSLVDDNSIIIFSLHDSTIMLSLHDSTILFSLHSTMSQQVSLSVTTTFFQ